MRRKLEGHKVAPPEGLWEDICKELDVRGHSTNRRWYYAVAAALLALAGFFAVYQFNNNNETKELTVKSETIAPEKPDAPASEDKVDEKFALATINNKVSKEDNLTKSKTPCEPTSELEPSAPEPELESDDDLSKDVLQEPNSGEPVTEPQAKKPVDDLKTCRVINGLVNKPGENELHCRTRQRQELCHREQNHYENHEQPVLGMKALLAGSETD